MSEQPIYCKRCGNKMILLLVSAVCDYCDPPGGGAKKHDINWWESFWYPFIGGTTDPALSKLNKPLHSSQVGNLTNGRARAVVLFQPTSDLDGNSKEAVVFDTKAGNYQHFNLMAPAKEVSKMPGMPAGDKYVHDLDTNTPYFGQYADKYLKMIILLEDTKKQNP